MKLSFTQVKNYLSRLGIGIIAGESVDLRTILPLNIASRYDAVVAKIISEEYIILFPRSEDISPDDIALHDTALRNTRLLRPIFGFSRLDREFASSLKSAKIAYIVPSRQVFIPPSVILESDRAYADIEFTFDKKRIWNKASPIFVTPVRYSVRVKAKVKSTIKSGVSALSETTDVVDNNFLTLALSAKEAKKIPTSKMLRYEGDVVEAWRYDPLLLNDNKNIVDPLSLCISLKDSPDPRIQIAIEQLLEKTLW